MFMNTRFMKFQPYYGQQKIYCLFLWIWNTGVHQPYWKPTVKM